MFVKDLVSFVWDSLLLFITIIRRFDLFMASYISCMLLFCVFQFFFLSFVFLVQFLYFIFLAWWFIFYLIYSTCKVFLLSVLVGLLGFSISSLFHLESSSMFLSFYWVSFKKSWLFSSFLPAFYFCFPGHHSCIYYLLSSFSLNSLSYFFVSPVSSLKYLNKCMTILLNYVSSRYV